jgi:chromosome segregation ATPase
MSRSKSSKNKDDKNKKNESETLKSLKSDQKRPAEPTSKSLISLKKIKKQLSNVVLQRKNDQQHLKELKKNTNDLSKQIKNTESQLSKHVLNKDLQQIKKNLEKKQSQFNKSTDNLSKEIVQLNDLVKRVEGKINSLEKQASLNNKVPQKSNKLLLKKISRFEEELNQFTDTLINPEYHIRDFSRQLKKLGKLIKQSKANYQDHDTQIKLLQTNTTNIRQLLQQDCDSSQVVANSFQQDIESHQQEIESHHQEIKNNRHDIDDLQSDLQIYRQEIETYQQETKQQGVLGIDNEHLSELNDKINQFNEQLKKSEEDVKNHIQLLRESDNNENLQHFKHLDGHLNTLSQQFSDASEQSISLQNLLNHLQEQQNSTLGQQDEIAKQFLTQQQHLESHDIQLNPILAKTNSNEQLLEQHSDTLKQLGSSQNRLAQHENKLKTRLVELVQQVNKEHASGQESLSEIDSKQQSQLASLEQLNHTVTGRSKLFTLGLITILAIAMLLFYYQNNFNQSILDNNVDKQELITQLKTTLSKESNIRIDNLEKHTTQMINQQLDGVKNSIKDVKKQAEQQALQSDWQEQHQLLQTNIAQTQTEQQSLKQTVIELSDTISAMASQIEQLKKISSTTSFITGIETINDSFYTIQLLGALKKDSILHFVKQHNLSETSKIVKTEYQNKPWYILVQGNYKSFSKAKEGLRQLPESLQKNNPWIKKLP